MLMLSNLPNEVQETNQLFEPDATDKVGHVNDGVALSVLGSEIAQI